MKITIICAGKLREPAWACLCDQYLTRLQRYGPVEILEVKEGRGKAPEVMVAEESARILDALGKERDVWILDERGQGLTSLEWAQRLQRLETQGRKRLSIVLGGAYGLDERVRSRGERISLSRMTFPHEFCRAILLEQLYRARTIQRGEPYHH